MKELLFYIAYQIGKTEICSWAGALQNFDGAAGFKHMKTSAINANMTLIWR